jgi:hypothetical protein
MLLIGYKVNDRLHYNALTAWDDILTQQRANSLKDFFLYFNNDIYDTMDWHVAPSQSIADLEVQHARTLRSSYDYTRVWFSGGSDSQSIVDAFLRSGSKIDEIVMASWTTLEDTNLNSPRGISQRQEWLRQLYARYQVDLPKVTVIDIGKSHLEQYFSKNYFVDQIGYGGTGTFSIAHVSECSKYISAPPVANYCDIFGFEKPRIFVENNQAYLQMNDRLLMSGATLGLPIEWFYLPRQTPDLIRAQLWSILNFALAHHKQNAASFINNLQTNKNYYHLWCTLCGRITTAEQNKFSVEAKNVGRSDDFSRKQTYLHLNEYALDQPQSWKNYVEGGKIEAELARVWYKNSSNSTLPGIITQKYFLTNL